MFLAAFTSAWQAKLQAVHWKLAWLSRDFRSTCLHALQRWLVNAGVDLLDSAGGLLLQPTRQEVAQRLLLYHLGAGSQPRVLSPRLRELPTLLQVTRSARPARMPVRVLLDREVPHVPGVRAVVPQHRFLGGGGEQPVPGNPV